MIKSILYIGLDVDDKNFHGGGFSEDTGEMITFKTKPTLGALMKKLRKFEKKGYKLKVCYEASYLGFKLCRDLNKNKIECEIIAPSLIPQKSGKRIKTDKIDSQKLAEYYAKDFLTPIYIPDEFDEQVRDLIRTRSFIVKERKSFKLKIISLCKRYEIDYKNETDGKQYWTKKHINWLTTKTNHLEDGAIKTTFKILIYQLDKMNESINDLEKEILKYSEHKRYKEKKDTLNCFKGLDTLSSMTLITELGDIKRFIHPNKTVSYAGLDIIEYSSGGKEKKFGITKMGNHRIRTTVIEACQMLSLKPKISNRLRKVRENQPLEIVEVAERCNKRLSKKYRNLYYKGKHYNKIKVACARELLCFVWEALQLVS